MSAGTPGPPASEGNGPGVPARSPDPLGVLIADDHPVVREGLRGMLAAEPGIRVVAEAASGDEAVALAIRHQPDVVLMDLRMPGGDGVQATAGILAALPGTRVIVLTTYESNADIVRAVEAGAAGYLLKDTPIPDLVTAIRAAARGETVLGPTVAGRSSRICGGPPSSRYPAGRPRCCRWSPGVRQTPTSAVRCSSARPLSRRTCCGHSASSACLTGQRQ